MNLILFSVTTFAVLDYFYRFMRFVSTDLAKIAKFLCFYSKSGIEGSARNVEISVGVDAVASCIETDSTAGDGNISIGIGGHHPTATTGV